MEKNNKDNKQIDRIDRNRHIPINIKKSNRYLQSMRPLHVLSLAWIIQAKTCTGVKEDPKLSNMRRYQYCQDIERIDDLSRSGDTKEGINLFKAINDENTVLVEVLLERIAKDKEAGKLYLYQDFPNTTYEDNDKKKLTPFGLAIKKGCLTIIDTFIKHRKYININKAGDNLSSFAYALDFHKTPQVAQLLKNKLGQELNITQPLPETNESPLQIAIRKDFKALVPVLINELMQANNPTNIWHKDKHQKTFLHIAAQYGKCKLLFQGSIMEEKLPIIIEKFFEHDKNGHSVFANAYLKNTVIKKVTGLIPDGISIASDSKGEENFDFLFNKIKDHLTEEQKNRVKNEILGLEKKLGTSYASIVFDRIDNGSKRQAASVQTKKHKKN